MRPSKRAIQKAVAELRSSPLFTEEELKRAEHFIKQFFEENPDRNEVNTPKRR